jgi:hypothetical protein
MVKRLAIILFLLGVLGSSVATRAQVTVVNVCPYTTHSLSLACLIPDLTQTGQSQNLARFNTTIAQVLGQLPLAAPVSGFVLGFDKATGQFIPLNENLGSVLTERGNTVGKHKVFVGFTAQRFVFHAIDGIALSNLPSAFQLPSVGLTNVYGASTNFMSANLNQYTGIIAVGLTDRIDVSVTVPFERVSLSAGYSGYTNAFLTYNSSGVFQSAGVSLGSPATNFVAGSASGFGDILVNMKGTVYSGEKNKLALGLEVRFPTGDEYNLLGTGAYGVKPYIVFSRLGRVTPHVNLGYQWNDFSNLYINNCKFAGTCTSSNSTALPTLQLPHSLDYSAGVDIGLVKKLTIVGDYVGQHYFNAPEVTPAVTAGGTVPGLPSCTVSSPPAACSYPGFPQFASSKTVGVTTGSINVDNVALGLKVNPIGRLILSANALIRLDTGGLRPDRFVPLVGISYRF